MWPARRRPQKKARRPQRPQRGPVSKETHPLPRRPTRRPPPLGTESRSSGKISGQRDRYIGSAGCFGPKSAWPTYFGKSPLGLSILGRSACRASPPIIRPNTVRHVEFGPRVPAELVPNRCLPMSAPAATWRRRPGLVRGLSFGYVCVRPPRARNVLFEPCVVYVCLFETSRAVVTVCEMMRRGNRVACVHVWLDVLTCLGHP